MGWLLILLYSLVERYESANLRANFQDIPALNYYGGLPITVNYHTHPLVATRNSRGNGNNVTFRFMG
jgi:hypothetical protein